LDLNVHALKLVVDAVNLFAVDLHLLQRVVELLGRYFAALFPSLHDFIQVKGFFFRTQSPAPFQ
jgi:hypothetical protein